MSIYEMKLRWIKTDHPMDEFGYQIPEPILDEGLAAKALLVWKEQTVGTFVKKTLDAAIEAFAFISDPSELTGFALAVSVVALIPLHVKLVFDDEVAKKFVELIQTDEEGEEYFDLSDLAPYPELVPLIEYYTSNGVLRQTDVRLYICGKVLNRIFLA